MSLNKYMLVMADGGNIRTVHLSRHFIIVNLPEPKRAEYEPGGVTADIYANGKRVDGPICDNLTECLEYLVGEAVSAKAYRRKPEEKKKL